MNERRQKEKKEILIYEISSVIFMVISFISVFLAVLLDNQQPDKNWITYGIIIFLLFNGIGLYLKNLVKGDKEVIRAKKRQEAYEFQDLKEVDFTSIDELKIGLESNKYELLSNGYYFKRSTSQGLCYYTKFINISSLKDSLEKELVKFKKFYTERCKGLNGIIFVSLPEVSDEDKAYVKELSKSYLVNEELLVNNPFMSIITVLVDEFQKRAYYFDAEVSYKTKKYTYGCLVLKKIFKK